MKEDTDFREKGTPSLRTGGEAEHVDSLAGNYCAGGLHKCSGTEEAETSANSRVRGGSIECLK